DGIRDFHVTGVQTCALPISLGVASLLRAYPPLFLVIKYAGAAYLAYVGAGMAIRALRRARGTAPSSASPAETSAPSTRDSVPARSEERRVGRGGRAQRTPHR